MRGRPEEPIWVHAVDLLEHVLQGDDQLTFWKAGQDDERLRSLRREMEQHHHDPKYADIIHDLGRPTKKWVEVPSEVGDLDVNAMLCGEDKIWIEARRQRKRRPGLTIILEAVVSWDDRDSDFMEKRHTLVYRMVRKCELEGRPCRVIYVRPVGYPEVSDGKAVVCAIVKDWHEPIFPGVWGALKNCATTNDLGNSISSFFYGTSSSGNGSCGHADLSHLIPAGEQVALVAPKYVTIKDSLIITE